MKKGYRDSMIFKLWDQNGLCAYCNVDLLKLDYSQITKDHISPKSKGGVKTNISCSTCNQLKKDMSKEDFDKWIFKNKKAIIDYNLSFNKRDRPS